jgi:hypothetical protein
VVVWKFPIPIRDTFTIDLPIGAKVLHAEVQGRMPTMWVLLNPKAPTYPHMFLIVGTGNPVGEEAINCCDHVATFQMPPFVWHLFAWRHETET